jgi:7,8-dihydro-6-hydroxymethylpterin-pyrophosphokinase
MVSFMHTVPNTVMAKQVYNSTPWEPKISQIYVHVCVQIKSAMTCNKNEQQMEAKNCRLNGRDDLEDL